MLWLDVAGACPRSSQLHLKQKQNKEINKKKKEKKKKALLLLAVAQILSKFFSTSTKSAHRHSSLWPRDEGDAQLNSDFMCDFVIFIIDPWNLRRGHANFFLLPLTPRLE